MKSRISKLVALCLLILVSFVSNQYADENKTASNDENSSQDKKTGQVESFYNKDYPPWVPDGFKQNPQLKHYFIPIDFVGTAKVDAQYGGVGQDGLRMHQILFIIKDQIAYMPQLYNWSKVSGNDKVPNDGKGVAIGEYLFRPNEKYRAQGILIEDSRLLDKFFPSRVKFKNMVTKYFMAVNIEYIGTHIVDDNN